LPDRGATESTQDQAIDLWRAESLVQYSILQSACNSAEVAACDAAEVVSGCWKLVTALKKLIELLSTGDLMDLCCEYNRVHQENTIYEQCDLADCILVNEKLAQPFKTPGRSRRSDLNRTDVFEIVEKICEQAEDERKALENELRKARYDLDRARESHEVCRKTISQIKAQLESENKRYACLEDSSSEVVSIIRDIATELDCFEPGLSGLQVAQYLKRRVKGLLTEMELKEKIGTLEATTSFINDLGVELKDLKADRARLREELESKNLLIQKLREEGTEKSTQIDRYRATFDALFEPNTAANFAKQVAEQYRRYESKSSAQGTMRSTSFIDAASTQSAQSVPRFGERHVPRYPSCQHPHIDAISCATSAPSPKPLLPKGVSSHNKENVPDNMAPKTLNVTQSHLDQEVCYDLGTKQTVKKPLIASPMTTDPKRIRLVEESSEAFTSRITSSDWRKQTALRTKHSHLNHRSQHGSEPLPTSKPSPPRPLSSTEKHDPGCPIS
uniref:RH1 domain-containing protein n=1 Tax=Taenia asiatica TaxID=60517 RepID=A0A158R6E9_TAEAS